MWKLLLSFYHQIECFIGPEEPSWNSRSSGRRGYYDFANKESLGFVPLIIWMMTGKNIHGVWISLFCQRSGIFLIINEWDHPKWLFTGRYQHSVVGTSKTCYYIHFTLAQCCFSWALIILIQLLQYFDKGLAILHDNVIHTIVFSLCTRLDLNRAFKSGSKFWKGTILNRQIIWLGVPQTFPRFICIDALFFFD